MAGISLPLGLCKEIVKESISSCILSNSWICGWTRTAGNEWTCVPSRSWKVNSCIITSFPYLPLQIWLHHNLGGVELNHWKTLCQAIISSSHQTSVILSQTPEPGVYPSPAHSQWCCNYWGDLKVFPRKNGADKLPGLGWGGNQS